jgi:hypothetical protein
MNDKQIAEIDLLALLHQLADASGQAIMPHYRTALVVDDAGTVPSLRPRFGELLSARPNQR